MSVYNTETKDKISDALWLLLKDHPLEYITITMICQEAGVGRRSFYRHFQSKMDVLEFGFKLKSDEFAALCAKARSMEELIGMFLQFFRRQRKYLSLLQPGDLLSILYKNIQSGNIFDSELDIYMERAQLPAHLREYAANCIVATHAALVMTWVEHNFQENWRDLARFEINMLPVMR